MILFSAGAARAEFDRKAERAKMLELAKKVSESEIKIKGPRHFDGRPKHVKFARFFVKTLWPVLNARQTNERLFEIWMVMIDRALYNDDAEKALWKSNMTDAQNRLDALLADKSYYANLQKAAELAQGLKGPLVDFVLKQAEQNKIEGYPAEALADLGRLSAIMAEVSSLSNESTVTSAMLAEAAKTADALEQNYFKNPTAETFEKTWPALEALAPKGTGAKGQDIAKRGEALFNEAAILRTRIARAKGFETWADLIMATQASTYAPAFHTAQGRIEFLEGVLSATQAPYEALMRKVVQNAQERGLPVTYESLRGSQVGLIMPQTETLLSSYFQLEKFEEIWRKTMRESGAPEEFFSQVNLDGYPRDKKQTHAYMARLSLRKPHTVVLDTEKLSVSAEGGAKNWFPAAIFIVQNMRKDGPSFLRTVFHEGGHALDYFHRDNYFPVLEEREASNSYSETHSTTMEQFLTDESFLLANGKTREGAPLSAKLAREYIMNSRISALGDLRARFAGALYDLKVWNVAYTPDSETFTQRSYRLRREASEMASLRPSRVVHGVDPGWSGFATTHFYGGQVRYIGYVFAQVAALLTHEELLNRAEKATGRRTLYQQPKLVEWLREGYYREQFSKPFPLPIERFIGKKFEPQSLVKQITEWAKEFVDCGGMMGKDNVRIKQSN